MLEQLKELLEMQRVLDESIFKEHGITEYPLENMKLALFDELGELLHEFPTKYKHWKKSAIDNREKGLEEYVDCLHFALSISYQFYDGSKGYDHYDDCHSDEPLSELYWDLWTLATLKKSKTILKKIFSIGNHFGFTWDEIYSAYKKKNAVNYERLKNNY